MFMFNFPNEPFLSTPLAAAYFASIKHYLQQRNNWNSNGYFRRENFYSADSFSDQLLLLLESNAIIISDRG